MTRTQNTLSTSLSDSGVLVLSRPVSPVHLWSKNGLMHPLQQLKESLSQTATTTTLTVRVNMRRRMTNRKRSNQEFTGWLAPTALQFLADQTSSGSAYRTIRNFTFNNEQDTSLSGSNDLAFKPAIRLVGGHQQEPRTTLKATSYGPLKKFKNRKRGKMSETLRQKQGNQTLENGSPGETGA